MPSNEEQRLQEEHKALQRDMQGAYQDFIGSPNGANFQKLYDTMLDYQTNLTELLAEREAIKAHENKKSS